ENSTFNYEFEYKRTMREPNIHLRGVALRLYARGAMDRQEPLKPIESALIQSEKNLKRAGDPIQLGKTRLEIARLKLLNENRKEAYEVAQKARRDFGSYEEVFFPDDLRPLITLKTDTNLEVDSKQQLLNMFADVIQEFSPCPNFDRLLARIVHATKRFFGAERGGIFWFSQQGQDKEPILRGASDLSNTDIASEKFKSNLALVFTAYHEKCPQVVRCQAPSDDISSVKAMLCVPLFIKGETYGVLYHDNSYLKDCFDNFDTDQLSDMSRWLSSYIEHFSEFAKNIEKKEARNLKQFTPSHKSYIVTKSPMMLQLLEQADKISESDSSVMILGETGVGKELLARRIHETSLRVENPYVIVDLSATPENLVESELFGHEKGAFTGADRQKKGKVELAHKGTLFIDEIAEIPKSIQVKLLRTLQDKTFNRIGGTETKHSDFRLLTATNRDLAEQVSEGHFREDLFYRLNVVPLTIPPLRKRPEDIILLAQHFLEQFAYRYNKKGVELNQKHKTMLKAHDWPGNIRELQNTMERAVLLSTDGNLNINLPLDNICTHEKDINDLPTLEEMQRRYIRKVVSYTNGKISGPGGAAEILGLKRTTLLNRMKKLGLK
ncbi:MAG: sigma 54-interacting transcriptional regulator, partial [Desulfobacterales bacterium]|nr:sigma 54-interacting transcriptional regulator [Desulfobacterales bacterium]